MTSLVVGLVTVILVEPTATGGGLVKSLEARGKGIPGSARARYGGVTLSPYTTCITRCSSGEGLCPCRPHLQGRDCLELQSGYFCAALDQVIAEAELGQRLKPSDPRLPVSM